ncbi:MAG: hypothetical protein WDA16_03910 [Candidatus Thermoplasmatota archaeon]
MRPARLVALFLVVIMVLPALPTSAQTPDVTQPTTTPGHRVSFNLTKYDDTLFASITTAYRVAFGANGDIWYSTQAGVVHLKLQEGTRELYTHEDGLPSSLALGLATDGNDVLAGTDLGLAVIDQTTHKVVRQLRLDNSALPDDIIHEVAIDGRDVLLGTHFSGVATWNRTTDAITTKNTSTIDDFAKPVRRIVATPTTVWAGTDGDGAWRFDRASGNWSVLLKNDGLPSNSVLSFAELNGKTYIGTDAGLVEYANGAVTRKWNKTTDGMPDDRVYDLDVVPRADGTGSDLWAATRSGMWQLVPGTNANQTYAQDWGLMGSYVWDDVYDDATQSWVFGTTLGVSLANQNGWTYYSTGPTNAPSPGPINYRFTAVHAADGLVWTGSELGVSAFAPASATKPGIWYNLGAWQDYPGGQVNSIKRYGNMTWFATSTEAVGYNTDDHTWSERKVTSSRNIVYGLDAAQGELWIGLFGDGVIMQNLTTGTSQFWNSKSTPTPIPDSYITDVHIDGNTVWLGASVGVIRMDRISGAFITYTTADGIPGGGVVFRALPDGSVVYVGTKDGGVGRLDVASGKVDKVWDNTTVPGFPMDEVRDLYREGGRLWVGTKGGLARINVTTGDVTLWNQSNSKLVQNFVSGITSQDGILYLATASGIARMDIATSAFLPMRDGPDTQHGTGGGSTHTTFTAPVNVRIDSPKDGVGVTGMVEVRGAASKLGGRIDRVEVQIGDGPWRTANGTESWTYKWDSSTAPSDKQLAISVHALAGNETSRDVDVLVTPVALPTVPLSIEHTSVKNKNAGQSILVGATIHGDEPLGATAYYKVPGRDAYDKLDLVRAGNVFAATIPGRKVTEGTLQYYIEAHSGLLSATSPEDAGSPWAILVGPPARVAVSIDGPILLSVQAGSNTRLTLNVTNIGTESGTFTIIGSGLRASWLSVPAETLTLAPGEVRQVNATLDVPILAFADNTTLRFQVDDIKGEAQSAEASVPVEILSAPEATRPTVTPTTKSPVPVSPLVPLAGLALAALGLRRWRK